MESKVLKVSEYIAAATLKAKDVPFLGTEPAGRRVTFLFDDAKGDASHLLRLHENGGLDVNSSRLAAELNFIKSAMFAAKDRCGEYETRGGNSYRNGTVQFNGNSR